MPRRRPIRRVDPSPDPTAEKVVSAIDPADHAEHGARLDDLVAGLSKPVRSRVIYRLHLAGWESRMVSRWFPPQPKE